MENIIVKWVGRLLTGLKEAAGGIVAKALGFLGLTWANFAYVMPEVKSWLVSKAAGLSATAHEYLSAFGVDIFMTLIVSAVVARVGMKTFLTSVTALENMVQGSST